MQRAVDADMVGALARARYTNGVCDTSSAGLDGDAAGPAAVPLICVGKLQKGREPGSESAGPALPGFDDVRVDRKSPLGNPFPMGANGKDEAFRDPVCEACDELLDAPGSADVDHIAARHGVSVDERFRRRGKRDPQAELVEALDFLETRVRAGRSLRLLCWCHPARCHGDGIAALLRRRVGPDGVRVVTHNAAAAHARGSAAGSSSSMATGGAAGGAPPAASSRAVGSSSGTAASSSARGSGIGSSSSDVAVGSSRDVAVGGAMVGE